MAIVFGRGGLGCWGLVAMLPLSHCLPVGTPRVEDSRAPREYYRSAASSGASCGHPVEIVPPRGRTTRSYQQLATLSATCYPGTPELCERRLAERACGLEADAVLLLEPSSGGAPRGASSEVQVSLSGRAVRWTSEQ